MSNLFFMPLAIFKRLYHRLWLRVTLYSLLATLIALASGLAAPFVPDGLAERITPDAVLPVLTILASSLLAVTTFSLNVMVTAHRQAAASTTPRVHRLLLDDTTTQAVLAVFLGAFIYALLSIILFRSTLIPASAAVISMGVTMGVVVLIIVAMVRWIDHLSSLGSLDDTLRLAVTEARTPLLRLKSHPARGATPITDDTLWPEELTPVPARRTGYVQIVNVGELADAAGEDNFVYVAAAGGHYVLEGRPVAYVSGTIKAEEIAALSTHFVIGPRRTGEQDPAIGLITLSEIASRALSPAVNDSGTALEATARLTELLWDYGQAELSDEQPRYPRVFMREPDAKALVSAAFDGIVRDGAGRAEVVEALADHLDALSDAKDTALAEAALVMRKRVLEFAALGLPYPREREEVADA